MRLLFVGDVMLGRLVNNALRVKPPEFPWGDVLPVFKGADLRVCNLECVISDNGSPWSMTPKAFHFRTDARNVEVLKRAGIDAVTLANNHTLDYEYAALIDTLAILDKKGIRHAGAGSSINSAQAPDFLESGGRRIALIAFTDNEPDWEATEERAGVFYAPVDTEDERAKRLFDIIRDAKKKAGIVIVSAHWGPNRGYRPVSGHIPFAHALVDSGATIIFGHSCHVFQGVEIYKGCPIIYGAGDFIDDYAVDDIERNDESFIFLVEADDEGVKRMLLFPTMIIRFQARLARGFLAEEIAIKMKNLCREFNTRARWIEDEGCLEILVG